MSRPRSRIWSKDFTIAKPPAFFAAFAAFTIFAGQFVVSKHGIDGGLAPFDILLLRFVASGSTSVVLFVLWGVRDFGGIGWLRGGTLAVVAGVPYTSLVLLGVSMSPAVNAVVINPGSTLIAGTVLAAVVLKEHLGRAKLTAGLMALVGLAWIGWTGSGTWEVLAGDLLLVCAGFQWAIYSVLLSRWQIDPLRGAAAVSALSLWCVPIYLLSADTSLNEVSGSEILLQLVFQGFVHALLAMALFGCAVRSLGVSKVALMTPAVPMIGMIISVMFLHESVQGSQIAGAALVCLALIVAARANGSAGRW